MPPKHPATRKKSASSAVASVDEFLAALKHPHKTEIQLLRGIILGADPSIAEGVKWNSLSFRTTK